MATIVKNTWKWRSAVEHCIAQFQCRSLIFANLLFYDSQQFSHSSGLRNQRHRVLSIFLGYFRVILMEARTETSISDWPVALELGISYEPARPRRQFFVGNFCSRNFCGNESTSQGEFIQFKYWKNNYCYHSNIHGLHIHTLCLVVTVCYLRVSQYSWRLRTAWSLSLQHKWLPTLADICLKRFIRRVKLIKNTAK